MTDQEVRLLSAITSAVLSQGVTFLVQYISAISKSKELETKTKELILDEIVNKVKEVGDSKFV